MFDSFFPRYFKKLSSVELWNEATRNIIGGCGLLSKRPTRYLSRMWPNYALKSKGITLYTWSGNKYLDFTEFSIGCCLLGYNPPSHKSILNYHQSISPLTSLLTPFEPLLANTLNDFFSQDRVWKFCRGGGEVLAVTARFARTVAKNSRILVCGYHGTHDWYLSANLNASNSLSKVFLSDISPVGLPNEYRDTTFSLPDFDAKNLANQIHDVNPGTIVFESCRYELLSPEIRSLLLDFQSKGGILVSDEVTSGFRFREKLACFACGLNPDFIVLGKSLGNGYAISAVGSFRKYKNQLEQCFLSSTQWTESIGLQAAVCTLKEFHNWEHFYKQLSTNAERLREAIIDSFENSMLKITINSVPTMLSFKILPSHGFTSEELRTLLLHLLLERNIMMSTTIYPSIAHDQRYLRRFAKALSDSVAILETIIVDSPSTAYDRLKLIGPIENGFKRTQTL